MNGKNKIVIRIAHLKDNNKKRKCCFWTTQISCNLQFLLVW